MNQPTIADLRILIMEDEALVAMMIEDTLIDLGCEVVGPFSSIERGITAIEHAKLDGAFLDVNLRGEFVYPVADALAARATPFVFVTGYGEAGVHPRFRGTPVLTKPFVPDTIEQLVRLHMNQRRGVAADSQRRH
jgi:CheY-like chemotaxis protein